MTEALLNAIMFVLRFTEIVRLFGLKSALLSVNSSWRGGIHIQSCGHHMHYDCRQSYCATLKQQYRVARDQVGEDEAFCFRHVPKTLILLPGFGHRPRRVHLPNVSPDGECVIARAAGSTKLAGRRISSREQGEDGLHQRKDPQDTHRRDGSPGETRYMAVNVRSIS